MTVYKAIVAVCDDWGIGLDGDMVVANKADMRHFVRCTKGYAVLMGRKTLESFPGGKPLKGRRNVVLTRDGSFAREGVDVVHALDEAFAALSAEDEVWVIGGGAVYKQMLPYCSEAVVTKNHAIRRVDTCFPNLDAADGWALVEESDPAVIAPDEGDAGVSYSFCLYRNLGVRAHA